jgi:hypothetical protein
MTDDEKFKLALCTILIFGLFGIWAAYLFVTFK